MANLDFYSKFNLSDEDAAFSFIVKSLKSQITTWDYFVNWSKVIKNVDLIEKELNILNYIIGKNDIEKELLELLREYPQVIKAIPSLFAVRESSLSILLNAESFLYKKIDFAKTSYSDDECKTIVEFFMKAGLGNLVKEEKIKNFVDYVAGVEVGLDSNGRKNRGGTAMEKIIEVYIKKLCALHKFEYISQANANAIKKKWNIDISVDKSSRIIDFVINKNGKLFFIEVNFYGGGGSKLKSTATEYSMMQSYWKKQHITFIWITDGFGWTATMKPLREYFDKGDYLLNLELVNKNGLEHILVDE